MIVSENLCRDFKVYAREPGFRAVVKSFFKRSYTINPAVRNFNLNVDGPELIGLLGPNGSGKTTLMKMFTGIIIPSSGSLKILGDNPWRRKNDFKKNISLVMGQKSQLWWDIPVMDSLLLFQKYYEIEESQFKKRVSDLGERLEVMKLLHIPVRKLSLGERMKMELMACLLHEPKIIFLDEPTIGLDIRSQKNVREFLKDYYEKKKPLIILTSHYMADVEALCKRIVLITKGEKQFDGKMEDFRKLLQTEKTIVFNFHQPVSFRPAEWENRFHCEWSGDNLQLKVRLPEEKLKDLTVEVLNRCPVSDFHTEKVSIEEIMDKVLSNPALLSKQGFS
ncbi:MAG: ATP-binding cassette domain-containing protein [Bdellovibrionales bacterium]|nr:ATP-binding cassette domain-containing protein [Bdellovibrionales bacterium]